MGWIITATLNSALCLTENRGVGNVLPTLDFIPGTTLRGALASRWLSQPGHSPHVQDFKDLFLSEEVSFPNLYSWDYLGRVGVLPLSARSCKYYSGFLFDGQGAHGVRDAVIPWLRYRLGLDPQLDPQILTCGFITGNAEGHCQASLEPLAGYYTLRDNRDFHLRPVAKRLLARTAILETREVARPGALYTLEALNEGQAFAGEWKGQDAVRLKLQALLDADEVLFLGTARSRGLGEVKLGLEKDVTTSQSVKERLLKFNAAIYGGAGQITHFSLTLESDAVLLDDLLGYKSHIEINDLLEVVSNQPEKALLERFVLKEAWCAPQRLSGWQAVWKLPKPEEQAIRRGSVFVYGLKDSKPGASASLLDDEVDQLAKVLEYLEDQGVGERPTEGYGRVRVCHEFHRAGKI